MIPYLIVFVIAFIYFLTGRRKSNVPLLIFFLYVALFVGLGDMIGGYDRYIYGEEFDTIADAIRNQQALSRTMMFVQGSEYGYWLWNLLIAQFTANRYIFILLTILLIYTLFYRAFVKYLEDYPLTVIVFMGFVYYFSMTYLRQMIAVGICWQAVQYLWKRKPLPFFIIILIATTFHSSALLFAGMYFVPIRKYPKSFVLIALAAALLLSVTPLPNMLISQGGDVTGKGEGHEYENEGQGFRIDYVLEVLFFLFVYFSNYNRIDLSKRTLTFLNINLVQCVVLLFFMRFGQGGRFAWPFAIGAMYMLPYCSNCRGAQTWTKPLTVIVSALLFLRISYAWEGLNAPYKTFLSNGEPAGDGLIYQKYEYDHNYTYDKFYRK